MFKTLSYPLLAYSVTGFVIGAVVNVAACLGIQLMPFSTAFKLSLGIMIAAVPAILISNWLTRDYPRKRQWKASLVGAPKWMRTTTGVCGGYAIANFILFAVLDSKGKGSNSELAQIRFFTAYWLAFYSYAAATFYSVIHWPEGPKCPLGHQVSRTALFCDRCGAPIGGAGAKQT